MLSLRSPPPDPWAQTDPANETGVRTGPVPSSPCPGLTRGTQLPLSARQQCMSRNLLNFPPEKSNGIGGGRTLNLTSQSVKPLDYQYLNLNHHKILIKGIESCSKNEINFSINLCNSG